MTTHILALALAGLGASPPQAPVRVVATLPVYAEITREIGGDQVAVTAIADPREDAHFVRPKPSFAADIRRADMFVTTGLDLELWVPPLLDRAGNAKVREGGIGYVTAYTGVRLLDVPATTDRSGGDIHIYGNPHVFTDPLNAILVARNITAGLKKVAPDRSVVWDRGLARFTEEIQQRLFGAELVEIVGGETLVQLARSGRLIQFLRDTQYEEHPLISRLGGWLGRGLAFRGRSVICYHKNWAYLEDRFGVRCVEYVEAKPGIPPTPGHVAALIRLMQDRGIRVLLAANYFSSDKIDAVVRRAGAEAVVVPLNPGGAPGVDSYFDLVDAWVDGLARPFSRR